MMCPVYNLPMLFKPSYADDFKASVDRKNSKKGYVKGNVIWISLKANKYKNAMNLHDVEKIHEFMIKLDIENKYPELLDVKPMATSLDKIL